MVNAHTETNSGTRTGTGAGTGTAGAEGSAEIGVIGGSGFYSFLEDVTEVAVDTPYGKPSDSVFLGELAGRRVAFLPRHGRGHHLPPHRINYRANLWALRSVGVRQVLGPCAVGGLRPEFAGHPLLVPDQLVDRTKTRVQTYYDGETQGRRNRAERRPPGASPTRTAPRAAGASRSRRPADGTGSRWTAAPWWWSRAPGSRPARSRAGTRRWAGPSSA